MTNFCIPTLFDDRDLLPSVISNPWNKDMDIFQIIDNIPKFLQRVYESCDTKNFSLLRAL